MRLASLGIVFLLSELIRGLFGCDLLQAEEATGWEFYNASNSAMELRRSVDAQDGQKLVMIDTTAIASLESCCQAYRRFLPQGYLIQTLDAKALRGKHFHVSGFARSKKPDFDKLESWFEQELKDDIQEPLQSRKSVGRPRVGVVRNSPHRYIDRDPEAFAESIRSSNANAEFGIWVLLHTGDEQAEHRSIRKHTPTSSSAVYQPQLWNRFNVEVSIPSDCYAVSIVLWSSGLNLVEFDHLTMVEHGDALQGRPGGIWLDWIDGIDKRFKESPLIIQNAFSNPSFEY